MKPSYGDDSPIAAFATAPGKSALTLIRCSGKGAIELAASVFSKPNELKLAAGSTLVHGWVVKKPHPCGFLTAASRGEPSPLCGSVEYTMLPKAKESRQDNCEKIDEVLVSVFRAPKSYTGEDSIDISCHGGICTGTAVMEALKACGFRTALPGEFTFRAFMNGKLDLTRSESVMELVSAKTDVGRSNAIQRLSGLLEEEINSIKKLLVEVLAGAELYLDYSEDEISAEPGEKDGILPGQNQARRALIQLQKLKAAWNSQRIYQEGITTVIAGKPNAGKSSLFNYLLKEDRSIVTEIPGTTRDWIEAWVSIEGIPVRLIDTAGLRESTDSVEALGVQRTRELLDNAEIILYLIDGTCGISGEDKAFLCKYSGSEQGVLPLWNKADLAPRPQHETKMIALSVLTGEGIAELSRAIVTAIQAQAGKPEDQSNAGQNAISGNAANENTGYGNAAWEAAPGSMRQKNLIDTACTALQEALSLAEQREPLDLIAPLLREAVNALGEITGEVSNADILEEMFSKFCVGK